MLEQVVEQLPHGNYIRLPFPALQPGFDIDRVENVPGANPDVAHGPFQWPAPPVALVAGIQVDLEQSAGAVVDEVGDMMAGLFAFNQLGKGLIG